MVLVFGTWTVLNKSPDMFSTNDLKKDHLALLPVLSSKVCISDAMECISANGIGNTTINAKSV